MGGVIGGVSIAGSILIENNVKDIGENVGAWIGDSYDESKEWFGETTALTG